MNAPAAGMPADVIAATLDGISRYPVPQAVLADVRDLCARYGRLSLVEGAGGGLELVADEPALLTEVAHAPSVAALLGERRSPVCVTVAAVGRGGLKQALVELGWPVRDEAPFADGARLEAALAHGVEPRAYQADADARRRGGGPPVRVGQDARRARSDHPALLRDADRDLQPGIGRAVAA